MKILRAIRLSTDEEVESVLDRNRAELRANGGDESHALPIEEDANGVTIVHLKSYSYRKNILEWEPESV